MSAKLNFLIKKRYFSSSVRVNKSFFVTTPIFYVNAAPHIGHLYSAVIADTIQRWQHIIEPNQDIVFSTGTDEHGIKIQNAALQNNVLPKNYCENISSQYKALFNQCQIGYTDFIRTSSNIAHFNAVQHFWIQLRKSGKIYSANYQGWYCVPDETFLTESQITEKQLLDGRKIKISNESGHPVEWTQEKNYLFRLSAFQQDLYNWLKTNENIVKPKKFQHILMDWLSDKELPDISVSRPASRVHWGIPVPQMDAGEESSTPAQTIYVWLDALINYLTVAGYPDIHSKKFINSWPPDVHIVGKDILKFHGIYWPAFLMACQLPLPKQILCHSHWTVNGEKMSKSKGNVIAPQDLFETYTSEGLRYFLIREGVPHSDGNYSETKLCRILNSELADTFGNLLSRCCGKALNPEQIFPTIDEETLHELCLKEDVTRRLLESVETLPDIVREHYNSYNFYKGIDQIITTLHLTNLFFETLRPWELKKSNNKKLLNGCLCITLETLRVCAILLQPIIPQLTNQLLTKINVSNTKRDWNSLKPLMWQHYKKQLMYANDETNRMQQIPIPVPVSLTNDTVLLFKRIQMQNKKN